MRKTIITGIIAGLVAVILSVLLLVFAPSIINKTAEYMLTNGYYRDAVKIHERVEDGKTYTKEDIFETFGTPHYYYDDSEQYSRHYIYKGDPNLGNREGRYTQEEYDEMAYRKDVTSWHYSIYRYSDGSDPHSISIKFNEDGKVVSFKMERMGGG